MKRTNPKSRIAARGRQTANKPFLYKDGADVLR
jgi:hypothetical protein